MSIRSILHQVLGLERYLKLISGIFLRTYLMKAYLPDHKLVRNLHNLVKAGDTCIDIGANLGYFSVPLSRLVGPRGRVLAVEPVAVFRSVLHHNLGQFSLQNVEVFPFALGEEDGAKVEMVTPSVNGTMRHGRTSISTGGAQGTEAAYTHKATVRQPMQLFGSLTALHYVKCDVEGYEMHILPHFMPLFEKFRPIIEVEADPMEHKMALFELLKPLGYQMKVLKRGSLHIFDPQTDAQEYEVFFLPD